MSGLRDPEKRPLYVDRKNGRFFAEPVLGTPWQEVLIGGAAVYTAGDGLDLANGEFSLDLKSSSGLQIENGELTLSIKINGGIVLESGALAVNLGASSITGTLGPADGGTGHTSYAPGQLLIGKADGTLAKATLTEGANISITEGDGTITITGTGGGASYTAGNGLDLNGAEFSLDLKANSGLIIDATELSLSLKANGGVVLESGALAVKLDATNITGTLGVADGGTGQTSYSNGELLIGNSTGNTLSRATLTQGAGISITNGAGSITIAATGPTLEADQTWSGAQRGAVTALTSGTSIAIDLAASNNFSLTLTGNGTLSNPSNATAGQSGAITIKQDGTGNRTLAYGSNWKFAGGTDPTLSTAANAVDILTYYVVDGTTVVASLIKDVK